MLGIYCVFFGVSICVCCICESLCGPMASPVHGFMNILLWTKSPRSDAQMDGEGERQPI